MVKLPESTEWVLHCAASLAMVGSGPAVSAAQLAEHFDVPVAYLAKQLKALVRAGVLTASTGPRGGFRLARPAEQITLLQIVEAVDGPSPFYVCRELRQQGRGASPREACRRPCGLAAAMAEAERMWRDSLRSTTLADILDGLPAGVAARTRTLLARPS